MQLRWLQGEGGVSEGGDAPKREKYESSAEASVRKQTPADPLVKMMQVTCARCHKLTHEGRVNSLTAEMELPPFDLAATVGTKIARRTSRRAVVLVVIDIADFDGSLPRCAPAAPSASRLRISQSTSVHAKSEVCLMPPLLRLYVLAACCMRRCL